MAFTVAPTSGDAPYILSADVAHTESVDRVHYIARIASSQAVGSCPTVGEDTSLAQSFINTMLATGSTTANVVSVPAGSCRTFTLNIIRLSDNAVIDTSSVSIDNV